MQNTIEIASGNRKKKKTTKQYTDNSAQRPAACSAASSWARGPTANGRAAELARRGFPLGPIVAHSSLGHRRPSDQIRRSSGLFA